MARVKEWFEERFGLSTFARMGADYLAKPVPTHVNYAFTLGTAALVLFATQIGSGILLALNYTSSMKGAYESVWRITHELPSGWLIRSFHAWGSHLMVLVLLLHMTRVFWYGGYKKPRELTWIFGCGLLFLTMTFGFTGYLLPMDQVSYWGTKVATDPVGEIPGVGEALVRALRGSEEVSDATLSRFYILHVFLLPAAVAGLVGGHLWLVARLGISTRESVTEEQKRGHKNLMKEGGVAFSRHLYREITTVVVVLGLAVTLAVLFPHGLGDEAQPNLPTPKGVKPEWYFLPVYQLLKYFPELVGMILVNAAVALLVMLPFLDRNPERVMARRKFMLAAAATALVVTFALGLLGWISDKRMGSWEFDIQGIPHKVQPK